MSRLVSFGGHVSASAERNRHRQSRANLLGWERTFQRELEVEGDTHDQTYANYHLHLLVLLSGQFLYFTELQLVLYRYVNKFWPFPRSLSKLGRSDFLHSSIDRNQRSNSRSRVVVGWISKHKWQIDNRNKFIKAFFFSFYPVYSQNCKNW